MRLHFLLFALFLVIGPIEVRAGLLGMELVVNGDAETGDNTGWTSGGIDAVANGSAGTAGLSDPLSIGSFSFYPGTGVDPQTLSQSIDVSGLAD